MKVVLLLAAPAALLFLALSGCQGRLAHASEDREEQKIQPSNADTTYKPLYQKYCSGCHGADGQNGPATDLANPDYQALIDDATLRDITAKGQKGTSMPGFAKSSGGELTEQQIDSLLRGIRQQWSKGDVLPRAQAPAYKATTVGDAERGKQVYTSDCARCHGQEGGPPGKAGSILDGSFLGLIVDQTIRSTAIAGRPDLGMPNFRNQVKGRVLSDQDVTDVVAFVASHRPKNPGQPYPTPQTSSPQSNTQPTSGSQVQ